MLVAAALARHRFGLWALAAGLALSFAAIGIFIATLGASLGVDSAVLRVGVGMLLVAFGAVMAVPALQRAFAAATARFASGGDRALARVEGRGWTGQFAVGLLLGVVWTPCVGPTLGAASTLASQGTQLGQVAALMLVFGLGAATPLVAIGTLTQRFRLSSRPGWLAAAETIRRVLGVLLVGAGLLVLTGLDKSLEAWLLDRSPDWLTELTTRF
ncbi:MAG: cytochrome c biogenesis protein CcdA [Caldimonas sp.]